MRRLGRAVTAAAACVALITPACGASSGTGLSKDLIPARALQSGDWGLRVGASGRVLNPFGLQPSGAPLDTANVVTAEAVAVRQWLHGSGALTTGPLPQGIFSVIDRAARFRSAADARALVAALSNGYGTRSSPPVPGSLGAVVLTAPFVAEVPGGQVSGHEELVVIERGTYVFTVLVVGGGSRPTSNDALALAALQAAAIPASLS